MSWKEESGVLLVNLGSPDSYDPRDVKKYLDEFLMDGRVIDLSKFWRSLIVRGIILRTRPKKSAALYRSIWWNEGAPLLVLSERLRKKVQGDTPLPVALGMRYGNPSIEAGLQELKERQKGLKRVFVLPLYPHYAMSSFETVVEKAREVQREKFPGLGLDFLEPFYNEPDYVDILAKSIEPYTSEEHDHLLFSYHGIPERHLKKTDPTGAHCLQVENCCAVNSPAHRFCYRHQVIQTTELVAASLGLDRKRYSISFQSRLGSDPWLKPYTDHVLKELPEKGVKRLLVVCPAFVSDCLETLEEIAGEGRKTFVEHGGESFQMIPCLNDRDDWSALLARWVGEKFEEIEERNATV